MAPLKVLVCGGGIAGPVLAYWLSRIPHAAGLSVTIMERSFSPRTTGQGIDIRGPAVKIMQQMSLEAAVRERHTGEQGQCFPWLHSGYSLNKGWI
jgi:2-polyprenyl-6-methoxyphenol hydroxylase-like FAD-dependent oxidoreductase